MKTLYILGAFDRPNYGDLLFPIILNKKLSIKLAGEYVIKNIGLIRSDLTKYGGLETESYKYFFSKIKKGDAVIVAGGEVLPADYKALYTFIYGEDNLINFLSRFENRFKFFTSQWSEFILRKFFYSQFKYPFIIEKNKLPKGIKVIYNSVGGSFLTGKKKCKYLKKHIETADDVSFRDKQTQKLLDFDASAIEPDIAGCLNTLDFGLFQKDRNFIDFLDITKSSYLVFQISKSLSQGKLEIITEQLIRINELYNLGIVLLPIGIAQQHEDDLPLRALKTKLGNVPSYLQEDFHVNSILHIIANAKLYIGTSLHGCITAYSFNVPVVNLHKAVLKVKWYTDVWYPELENEIADVDNFTNNIPIVLTKEYKKLIEKSQKHIEVLIEQKVERYLKLLVS
jgi:hypothetical protein